MRDGEEKELVFGGRQGRGWQEVRDDSEREREKEGGERGKRMAVNEEYGSKGVFCGAALNDWCHVEVGTETLYFFTYFSTAPHLLFIT